MIFNSISRYSVVSVLLATIAFSLFNSSQISASSDTHELISASDLTRDAKLVSKGNRILMIEFSREYCGYCRLLEDEFLKPMLRNAAYGEKVVIRSISLSDNDTLIDFEGNTISADEFAGKYGVYVTPTLLFLDQNGLEVSDKLIGIWSVDFFGGYIDERIDSARGLNS